MPRRAHERCTSASHTAPAHLYTCRSGAPAAPVASAPLRWNFQSFADRPIASVAAAAPVFADAFDQLLAAEQGEARNGRRRAWASTGHRDLRRGHRPYCRARLAERLSEGVFIDKVRQVSASSERLVREEIARIRSAAQKKP